MKVDRSGGPGACHPWTAALNEFGYGLFSHDGESLAARWAYKHYVGRLDASEVVRHTCDNPACQNRRHWLKGSQAQNVRDACERGRQHRPRGERNVKAKLTEQQVLEIRSIEGRSYAAIAMDYGVAACTIRSIMLRATWTHL